MNSLLIRRWFRRFRRLVWRGLKLCIAFQFMMSVAVLTFESGMQLIHTGKTSFAIAGAGLTILLGLTILGVAITRVQRITHIHNHFPTPAPMPRAKKG